MLTRTKTALRGLHLALDAVTVVSAMWLAYFLHSALREAIPYLKEPPAIGDFVVLSLLTPPLWLALIAIQKLHRSFEEPWGRFRLGFELLKLHIVGLVAITLMMFLAQEVVNRSMVLLFLFCSATLMFVMREAIGARMRHAYSKGYGQEQLLLVGRTGPEMRHFVDGSAAEPLPPRVLGRLSGEPRSDEGDGPTLLGDVSQLETFLEENAVDHVLFFPPFNKPELVPGALRACEDRGVLASFSVDMVQIARAAPRIAFLGDQPFVAFDVAPKSPAAIAVKHGFDMITAGVALLLLSPVLLLAALAIALTMGRPVFFIQERAGLYGRRFRMLKFRTMVVDAESRRGELEAQNEMTGPVFKVENDPRVTRLGRLLRRTSIDELPQLINVLIGNMSLVGPRPLPYGEQQGISGLYRRRLTMRPGITGLWQVSGRSNIDFDQWMALDLQYVDRWSLGFDFLILLRTVPAVLFGRGAR